MNKSDLVNEVAKATLIKKEAAEAMEIFLGTIKKTLKKQEQEEIQRQERKSK